MSLSTARLRYLSAIRAVLPLMLAACKDPAQPQNDSGAAATTSGGPTTRPEFHMPSCPNGAFCVPETAKADADASAPAPYARCGATATHPEDAKEDSGFKTYRAISFSPENTAAERKKDPAACCYTWVTPCPGGRAFRDATGTPSVARTLERTDWAAAIGALATTHLSAEERAVLADHWTREAAFEHASIASFAQLTLDLLSVGAPPDLLEATQRATLDEIEHARITFALATAYGARPVGPAALAALPGTSRTLAALARSTFIDACVGESVASAALAEASRASSDPVLRDLLATMSRDEERHAELAWRIVAWALRAGGAEVAQVLELAKDEIVTELVSLARDVAASPADAELRAMVLREVVLPCTVAMLGASDHLTAGRQTVSMQSSLASH
jgi:hypothetical protein